VGSTCFINAVLQALIHCAVFTDWLNSKDEGDLPLKMQLKKLDTSSTTTVFSKIKLNWFKIPLWEDAQDAQEFLVCLLDQLITENIISKYK
jgi:ubiquitin C-terminal hydrolase